jgi:hypothetical protein
MPIAVDCECGRSYQVKSENAGKRFKCKSCGVPVTVPRRRAKQTAPSDVDYEDYGEDDDYADEYSDDNAALPPKQTRPARPKKKAKKGRTKRSVSMPAALPILGKLFQVLAVIYLVFAIPGLLVGFMFFKLIGAGIMFVSITFCTLGIKGAGGKGIPISRDSSFEGDASIVVGMLLIVIGIAIPAIVYAVLDAAIRQ